MLQTLVAMISSSWYFRLVFDLSSKSKQMDVAHLRSEPLNYITKRGLSNYSLGTSKDRSKNEDTSEFLVTHLHFERSW